MWGKKTDVQTLADALSLFVPRIALYGEDFKPTRHFPPQPRLNAEQTLFINRSNAMSVTWRSTTHRWTSPKVNHAQ